MAVERFKHDGEWKIIGSSSGKVQVSDNKLDSESINSVQNKVITKALEYKADIVDKLVNAYGIRSEGNVGYYMPNIGVGDSAHTLATKADIISNEALESKATMYNLYAMDDLTAEQLAANETAFEAAQNGEVAVYRVYTNDTAYALADVKIVDGPYLEAYVYVNTPNADSKQATIIKYTYTFEQSGGYTTSDKEEVTLPSIDKVNELIGSGGTGGAEEVYVGTGTPPESAKVWINPDAPGTGGGGTAGSRVEGARIYVIPQGVVNATLDTPYTLTSDESEEFLSQGDFSNTIIVADITLETGYHLRIPMRFGYIDGAVIALGEHSTSISSSGRMEQIDVTNWEFLLGDLNSTGEIMGATTMHSSGTINLT